VSQKSRCNRGATFGTRHGPRGAAWGIRGGSELCLASTEAAPTPWRSRFGRSDC